MILDKNIEVKIGARNLTPIKKYYPNSNIGDIIQISQKLCLEVARCNILDCICNNCQNEYKQSATRIIKVPLRESLCGNCMFLYGQENMKKTTRTETSRKRRSKITKQFYLTEYGKLIAKKTGQKHSEHLKSRTDLHKIFTSNLPRMYGENHPNFNPNKNEFEIYSREVRVITERTYKENINLINPNELRRTVCGIKDGYQLDHIVSVKFGFDNNISPEIIGGLENIQMLPWKENRNKWHK